MHVTNIHGLPETFLRAVENSTYTKGDADFSVTELIGPPQISHLTKRHADDLVTDVSDEIWKLLGTGVHEVLSQANEGHRESVEARMFATLYLNEKPYTISGQHDVYDDGWITDYKVTGTYGVQAGLKPEWEAQLNLYAWLCEKDGKEVNHLQIVAILRDWMKSRAGKKGYPAAPVVTIPVPLWTREKSFSFLMDRLALHTADEPVGCTEEERWMRGDRFIRCEQWCPVSEFCPQWKEDAAFKTWLDKN